MQRTLKKESKGLEIAQRETIETSLHLPFHRSSCPSSLFFCFRMKKKGGEVVGSFGGSMWQVSMFLCGG